MSDDYRARLIAARERLGLSPKEMAQRLLTKRQTYEQWEAGKRRTPGVAVIAAELLRPARPAKKQRAPRAPRPSRKQQVAALADGSKSAPEIAKALGVSPHTVYFHVAKLRREGHPVALSKFASPPVHPPTGRDQSIAAAVSSGATYADVARAHNLSRERVRKIASRMGALSPLARQRNG